MENETELFSSALDALGQDGAEEMLVRVEDGTVARPQSARLWHVRALLLRDLDRRREALDAFARARALAPRQPKIAAGLAHTLLEAGCPAIDAFADAMRLTPGDPDLIVGLTHALLVEGRSEEAILGLEQLLSRAPLWSEGHDLLTRIRWTFGERSGFARSYDLAIKAAPRSLDLHRAKLISLLHANQFEAVLAAVGEGRALTGGDATFDAHEAIALSESGEVARADPLFVQFEYVADGTVQVRRMRHLLRAGRPDQASALFDVWSARLGPNAMLPYATAAWRLISDPRWNWFEGNPNFVGVYDLAADLPPLPALAEHLRTLHTARGQQLEQSVRGGTQTEGELLTRIDPLIEQTAQVVRAAVQSHVAQLPARDSDHPLLAPYRDGRIRFAGSWSVLLKGGGHHSNHIHPMGWMSSALYVDVPEGLASVRREGWLSLGAPQQELGLPLEAFRHVEPKPGRLVLFPSTMWHGTVPFGEIGTNAERLTIAFDVAHPA